jgi:predicted metal-binding membrane protein
MDKAQKAVAASLIITSAIAWIASIQQPDMMTAMTTYNPVAISLFAASWTAGMAAMMFPAIVPMIVLYNTFVTNKARGAGQASTLIQEGEKQKSLSTRSLRVALFTGSYLLVWAITGVALLLGWSVVMNGTIMTEGNNNQALPMIYGGLLIAAGIYQFSPIKKTCIGYCESPMSFFMRRWKDGTHGAVRMGLWHGLYCLGCCWAYFMLMVALGWMNLLWMGLFAGIIFGEKMWARGIWVARVAGVGLAIVGILVAAGMLPSLLPSMDSNMAAMEMNEGSGDAMTDTDNTPQDSMKMTDNSIADDSMNMDKSDSMQMPIQ